MPHGTATRTGIRAERQSGDRDRGDRAPVDEYAREAAAHLAQSSDPDVPQVVLGLRLLALAVVAGSGALLPLGASRLAQLASGILAGAGVGLVQYLALRARWRRLGAAMILPHIAVWTWLVHVSGDQRSPLFVGYLLEVALSGATLARRGCVVAAVAGFSGYVLSALRYDRPLQPGTLATAGGFLAVGSVLTWLLIEAMGRQRRRLRLYQDALRERAETIAEELRLLGDYLGGALIGLDGLGRVASVNPACAPLLGIDPGSALGQPWQEVIDADVAGKAAITSTLCDAMPRRGVTVMIRRRDGSTVAVGAELWVSPTPAGRRTYLLMGEVPAEASSADPLRRLGEASAIVAHQIKNSLHALQALASELARERKGAAEREDAERLCQVVRGLATLSDDVLAMAGASRPPQEDVRLDEVLSSAALLARHGPGHVLLEKPDARLLVRARRGQLVHAFFNLLDNASRVTPEGEHVRVCAGRSPQRVTVEIADSGPGLPADLANAAAPVASRNGAGFGLMAARRFIEANGGTLTFHSGAPSGTVCRVDFPAAPEPGVGSD
jgi:nitrogen-specific signal transduction histidine kinase